jgi:predicted nucleotidyltransferase
MTRPANHGARPALNQLEERIRPLARSEDLRLVVLFGSSARGDASAGSDLDVAVDGGRLLDLVGLTNHFSVALAAPGVDLVDLRRADPVMLLAVAREGIPLYEEEPGAFVQFQSLALRRFWDTRKFREAERVEIRERLERLPRAEG